MALNKTAAAYLAYFAYIDQALDTPNPADFSQLLGKVPAGAANGPWTLTWGPALNDGTLCYVAKGADGTYGVAFRGTNTDDEVTGWFQNIVEDGSATLVPWLYSSASSTLEITTGTNIALALAAAATDPATGISLLDYLRGLAAAGPLELIVTGTSWASWRRRLSHCGRTASRRLPHGTNHSPTGSLRHSSTMRR